MPSITRQCDVLVVGGSAAGLAAALQLARQRRSVIVVDAGEPRNAPAAHMHSFLGRDGQSPAVLLADGRDEVRAYGVEVLADRVATVTGSEAGGFRAALSGGHTVTARRVVVTTGIVDRLPPVDGLDRHWGREVIHCPFCHGYEVRDRRVVHLLTHPMGVHPAALLRQLTGQLTVVLDPAAGVDEGELDALRAGGVDVRAGVARRVVEDTRGTLVGVELADGSALQADAVLVGTTFEPRIEAFAPLGLTSQPHPSGLGGMLPVGPNGATGTPGVYAAGNVTDPAQQVLPAAAQGSWVGAMVGADLAHEDLHAAKRSSATEDDWDHRYAGEQVWSGHPNGSLVAEVGGLQPGRALDVGAGEGGDAVWLAEQGWAVTANDISANALARIQAAADARGLSVEGLHADANAIDPFGTAGFDLVTAHYASIPRTPDTRAVGNLLGAVAPGGRLVIVGHDLDPLRVPLEQRTHGAAYDPDAYVRVEDFLAVVQEGGDWEVEVHETRARPHGAASHHVADVVLRARRQPGVSGHSPGE